MNDQERLWAGTFGDAYHVRNQQKSRFQFWLEIMGIFDVKIDSILELGAGQGDNLAALGTLFPKAKLTGVDVNAHACGVMQARGFDVYCQPVDSTLNIPVHDLVVTRGFLIHVPEEKLSDVFEVIHEKARNLICIAEYFSPQRREIPYRGYNAALWSDDYCACLLDRYPDLNLIDYAFSYSRDGGEDLTWFLLEKVK